MAVDNGRLGGRTQVTMTRRMVGEALVSCAIIVLASCSSGGSTTATTQPASSSAATSSIPNSSSSPGLATTTTPTSGSGSEVRNLPATDAPKSQLTAAYVSFHGFTPTDVGGTAPNSVSYAYDPSTRIYWAISGFVTSSQAGYQVDVSMQDAGAFGWFSQKSGGTLAGARRE